MVGRSVTGRGTTFMEKADEFMEESIHFIKEEIRAHYPRLYSDATALIGKLSPLMMQLIQRYQAKVEVWGLLDLLHQYYLTLKGNAQIV